MSIYKILAAPTQVPQSKTGGGVAMSNPSLDFSGENYSQLIEDLVFLIRQSCYIQLARVDAYLDGVVLAAEQVQDTRIRLLETPPEVTGWEFFGNILLTFMLESTIGGRFLADVTKRFFTPILRQNEIFMALPKPADSVALKQQVEKLTRMSIPDRGSFSKIRNNILPKSADKTGLQVLGPENVQLYHASLEALIQGTEAAQTNLAAAAKAIREGWQQPKPTSPPSLGATDSTGVAILAAAQHYASLTRLGIQVRHARIEALVRGQKVIPADLVSITDAFGWEDLELDLNGRKIMCDLSDIRCRYKLLFEAVIWARLYSFDYNQKMPHLFQNKAEFEGIPANLSNYWLKRFGPSVDTWNETQETFPGSFYEAHPSNQIRYLREYFWEITKKLPHLRKDQLTQRIKP